MNAEHKRIRIAAALILIGLLVERLTLGWAHPTAFFVYAGVGGLLLLFGVLLFLSTLLGGATSHPASPGPAATTKLTSSDDEKSSP